MCLHLRRWVTEPNGGMSGKQPESMPWHTTCSTCFKKTRQANEFRSEHLVPHVSIHAAGRAVLVSVGKMRSLLSENKNMSDGSERFKSQGHAKRQIASTINLEDVRPSSHWLQCKKEEMRTSISACSNVSTAQW
jgi:hypothetical protein